MTTVFDQNAAEFKANPYLYLESLREIAEIVPAGGAGTHVILSYELVKQVIADSTLSVRYIPEHISKIANSEIPGLKNLGKFAIVFTDPPNHQRLRRLHMNVFNSKIINNFNVDIQKIITNVLDQIEYDCAIDIVSQLADQIPRTVLSSLLGIRTGHQQEITDLLLSVRTLLEPTHITPRKLKRLEVEFQRCTELLQKNIDAYRQCPKNNFISLLLQQGSQNQKLTDEELQVSCALTYIAGHETTKALISSAAMLFAEFPKQWDILIADKSRIPAAIEEVIRYEPPLHFTTRLATKDFELGLQKINKGDLILLCLASANRDRDIFTNPSNFDVCRESPGNLSFGLGMHNCIGKHLAQSEVRLLIETMIDLNVRFHKNQDYKMKWANMGPTTRSLEVLQLHLTRG